MPQYFAFQARIEEAAKVAFRTIEWSFRTRNGLESKEAIDFDAITIVRWSEVDYRDYELDSRGNVVVIYESVSRDLSECGYVARIPIISA